MTVPDRGGTPAHAAAAVPAQAPPAQPSTAGSAAPAPARPADRQPRWRSRVLTAAALLVVALGLFFCYVTVSRTAPVTSDGASSALQAWSMLHGNWLLHGWWVSDVSFYTTQLPEYLLIETGRGLTPDVVHVAAGRPCPALGFGVARRGRARAPCRAAGARVALARPR